MAGIVFHFEPTQVDVFSGRDVILDAWNYAIKAAGDITECVIVDTTGVARQFDSDLPTTIVTGLASWTPPGSVAVVEVPWADAPGVSLWDFDHQTDWYVFGPSSGWADTSWADQVVHIPQAGQGALHSVHIASVVMLHRYGVIGGA